MAVYTVYEPPLRGDEAAPDPERFVFVRDGFSFWAFLLAPLWMLLHRLWLVLVIYLVVMGLVGAGLWRLGASAEIGILVVLLISLLVGLEASSLRRWTLARRGWVNLGVAVGDNLESAEQRFYDAWAGRQQRALVAAEPPPSAPLRLTPAQPDVIGLFPEPGAPR